MELTVNTEKLLAHFEVPNPTIHDVVTENRKCAREHSSKGLLPKFMERDYVLVAGDEINYVFVGDDHVVLSRLTMTLYLTSKIYDPEILTPFTVAD